MKKKKTAKKKTSEKLEDIETQEKENEYVNIFDQKTIDISDNVIEEGLETIEKLHELNITIGSPPFFELGTAFTQKFERLKLLKEVSKSQSQITNAPYRNLDKELSTFLKNKFAVKESDSVEGNIRNILEQIANDQTISIYDAGLMVKPNNIVLLLAKGGVIKKGKDILTISIKKLAGKSKLISNSSINAAFQRDSMLLNVKMTFNYIIKLDKISNELVCQLYKEGKFSSPKKLTEWLKVG